MRGTFWRVRTHFVATTFASRTFWLLHRADVVGGLGQEVANGALSCAVGEAPCTDDRALRSVPDPFPVSEFLDSSAR